MKTINGMKFHDVHEIAQILGVHAQTVRGLIRKGSMEAVRIGHADYVSEAALNAYLGIPAQA
jgi:excisionase family DNA binding protein